MLHALSRLKNYTIRSTREGETTGDFGLVTDVYFDDDSWTIRYFVVDTGTWLPGRQVLIAPESVEEVRESPPVLLVNLTRSQVENGPGAEAHQPISRQREVEMRTYYGWPVYWPVGAEATRATTTVTEPPREYHLRSADEVIGYYVQARDGEIGHIEDFIFDDATWEIRYAIIDTKNWWPGKKVLLSPHWITGINWPASTVRMELTRDEIKSGPVFDPEVPINRQYETTLHDHYGRPPYWD